MNLKEFDAKNMAERVRQWSDINSGSYHVLGLERMSSVLMQAFSELNCEGNLLSLPPIQQIDAEGNPNLVDVGPLLRFWKRPQAPLQVLLMGHMDTVFPMDDPFQKAFYKKEDSNILIGPGVCDMKGGLCIILEALKAFEKSPQAEKLGWELLINPDEEIGSLASAPYIQERAKSHQLALLFEPAMDEQGTLAGERKGSGKFSIVARGQAAHAGRDFALGKNAILALAEAVLCLENLNGKREGVTLNIGTISGGRAENIVADLAIAKVDLRIVQPEDAVWLKEEMDRCVEKVQKKRQVQMECVGHFTRQPKRLNSKTLKLYERVQKIAQALGQDIRWKPSGGCSDGNNLSSEGLPNVDTLGVCGGKIHSSSEYLLVDSLATRANLSFHILKSLAEQGF